MHKSCDVFKTMSVFFEFTTKSKEICWETDRRLRVLHGDAEMIDILEKHRSCCRCFLCTAFSFRSFGKPMRSGLLFGGRAD